MLDRVTVEFGWVVEPQGTMNLAILEIILNSRPQLRKKKVLHKTSLIRAWRLISRVHLASKQKGNAKTWQRKSGSVSTEARCESRLELMIRLCIQQDAYALSIRKRKKTAHSSNATGRGDAYTSMQDYTAAGFTKAGNMTPYRDEIHAWKPWRRLFPSLFSF
jgi:hypothetical protein